VKGRCEEHNIAHRFSTLRKADRIVVVEDEQVMGQGTHKNLVESNSPTSACTGANGQKDAESSLAQTAFVIGFGRVNNYRGLGEPVSRSDAVELREVTPNRTEW
jgi:hypothetical protein